MHQKIRNSLLRVVAVFLAFLILFPQIAGLTMPAFAAGSIIKKLEDNPFDGLRWATKQPISGYHGSYPTEIMGVTIDGVNYVAYCLNHDRYGSGDSPSIGEYGVKVYELDDPALQSNEEFINDKNILMYMQGVLASGGYTGGGDSAATALRIRSSSRQLFNNRFEAYGVTKFATQSYDLDCSASRLGLASNEYITDFRFEFGTVKAGFREENRPMILVTVLPNLANGYRFANRTDVGGKYNDKWFTSDYTWVSPT